MTDLLDFARGPAIHASMVFFVAGVFWRLASLFFLPHTQLKSTPRVGAPAPFIAATAEFFRRMKVNKEFSKRTVFSVINGWTFHVGLALIVFGLGAHIMFFKRLIGFSWPNLPSNLVFLIGVLTLASLIAALIHRLTSPVMRLISTADDYITWAVATAPLVTGLAATMHLGARYEILLAVHILSICVFLIWFPFGKLMHAFLVFITRGETGVQLADRGVKM
jgi:nitrate reductase gamma subunit